MINRRKTVHRTQRRLRIDVGDIRLGSLLIVGEGTDATFEAFTPADVSIGVFTSQTIAARELLATWIDATDVRPAP